MDGLGQDATKTAAFCLGPATGDPCLLIHGFTGSPWEMRPLGDALAQAGYFVQGIQLPGHGSTPEAMLEVGSQDWQRSVEDALRALPDRPVRVAGLSMGALLAIWLAAKHPGRIRALALLAPAVEFLSRPMAFARALGPLPLLELLRPWVAKVSSDIDEPRARAQAPVLPRFPSTRLRDLWRIQALSRAQWERVHAPSLILMGQKDHVVGMRGARSLERGLRHAPVRFLELAGSAHILPRDRDRERLCAEVLSFFRRY